MSVARPGEERHLQVTEQDGSPDVMTVVKLIVSNATLVDNGNGSVSILTGGGGGGGAPTTAPYVTMAFDAGLIAERVLTGTPNQVGVFDGGPKGAVTLSTPQDIDDAASPTFASLNLNDSVNQIVLDADGAFTGTITMEALTGNQSWTLPDETGILATRTWVTTNELWTAGLGFIHPTTVLDNIIIGAALVANADIILNADGSATFNEQGSDVDFRVESDTDQNALFLDAGNNRLGLGIALPEVPVHLWRGNGGGAAFNALTMFGIENGDSAYFEIQTPTNKIGGILFSDDNSGQGGIYYNHTLDVLTLQILAAQLLNAYATALVVNEASANIDFRVETQLDANMFFVDADTNRIGIGLATPETKVHLWNGNGGGAAFNAGTLFAIENNGNTYFEIQTTSATIGGILFSDNASAQGGVYYDHSTDKLSLDVLGNFAIQITQTAVVFNENSGNLDVRMESDNNANLFFLDASTDRIGIGLLTPEVMVHIWAGAGGGAAFNANSFIAYENSGDTYFEIQTPNTNVLGFLFSDNVSGVGSIVYSHSADSLAFRTNGVSGRLTIESDGTLNVAGTANYETLVTDDDDVPNKKYVDGAIATAAGYQSQFFLMGA